jgi:hypothetical protein
MREMRAGVRVNEGLAGGRPLASGMKLGLRLAEAVDVGGAEGSVIINYCESSSSGPFVRNLL